MGYFASGPTMWLWQSMAPAGMSASGPAAQAVLLSARAANEATPNSRLVNDMSSLLFLVKHSLAQFACQWHGPCQGPAARPAPGGALPVIRHSTGPGGVFRPSRLPGRKHKQA